MRSTGRLARLALRGLLVGGALVYSACSDSTSTTPSQPSSIVFIGANTLTGTVGQPLSNSLQIEIRDNRGATLPNIPFTVTVSSGTISGAPAKTVVGTTSVGTWTLGTTAGTQQLTVSSPGVSSLVLTANALPGAAAVASTEGAATSAQGTPGAASPLSPQVRITDSFGNPIIGAQVNVVITGGGSVQFPAPFTNSSGFATTGPWTLGSGNGTQTVSLGVAGMTPVLFTVTTGSQFNIDVRYIGTPVSEPIKAVFAEAVARIRQFIVGDIQDFTVNQNIGGCAPGVDALNEVIDDIIIFASVGAIDGVGGILGQAGPCFLRPGGGLPIIGRMLFDVADINQIAQSGGLNTTITHEMLHVLGFGIGEVWGSKGLIQGAGGSNPLFVGQQALAAYRALGGSNPVGIALENCVGIPGCGAGTRDSHWRELSFTNELMTGFLDNGSNPMSRFSVAALSDMGYSVSLTAADFYAIPGGNLLAPGGQVLPKIELREILLSPIGELGPTSVPRRR